MSELIHYAEDESQLICTTSIKEFLLISESQEASS